MGSTDLLTLAGSEAQLADLAASRSRLEGRGCFWPPALGSAGHQQSSKGPARYVRRLWCPRGHPRCGPRMRLSSRSFVKGQTVQHSCSKKEGSCFGIIPEGREAADSLLCLGESSPELTPCAFYQGEEGEACPEWAPRCPCATTRERCFPEHPFGVCPGQQ